jgi:hypothetical protein
VSDLAVREVERAFARGDIGTEAFRAALTRFGRTVPHAVAEGNDTNPYWSGSRSWSGSGSW